MADSVTETGEDVYQPAEQAAASHSMLDAGGVESSVTESVVWEVFGGLQRSPAVTTYGNVPAAAPVQENALETKGPPAGVVTDSEPCVQPAWPTLG